MFGWIATLPTTNLRILLSLVMAAGTGGKVMVTTWEPTWEWLAFLCVWAGLDVAQFTAKRITHTPPP